MNWKRNAVRVVLFSFMGSFIHFLYFIGSDLCSGDDQKICKAGGLVLVFPFALLAYLFWNHPFFESEDSE